MSRPKYVHKITGEAVFPFRVAPEHVEKCSDQYCLKTEFLGLYYPRAPVKVRNQSDIATG
jgi:hypothetical protein